MRKLKLGEVTLFTLLVFLAADTQRNTQCATPSFQLIPFSFHLPIYLIKV